MRSLQSLNAGLVSTNKTRFKRDGFDLDLSYITERIIAMGYPSQGLQGLVRNPATEVLRFLQKYHPRGCYRVYNLCIEMQYNDALLAAKTAHIPMYDGQAPPLHLMHSFCQDASAWLAAEPHNMVVVHCKAGKGRTGALVCALLVHLWLLHPELCQPPTAPPPPAVGVDLAEAALTLYGQQRTFDGRGVTIASQRRYVHYYTAALQESLQKRCVPGAATSTDLLQPGAHLTSHSSPHQPLPSSSPQPQSQSSLQQQAPPPLPPPSSSTQQQLHLQSLLQPPRWQVTLLSISISGLGFELAKNCTLAVWHRPAGHVEAALLLRAVNKDSPRCLPRLPPAMPAKPAAVASVWSAGEGLGVHNLGNTRAKAPVSACSDLAQKAAVTSAPAYPDTAEASSRASGVKGGQDERQSTIHVMANAVSSQHTAVQSSGIPGKPPNPSSTRQEHLIASKDGVSLTLLQPLLLPAGGDLKLQLLTGRYYSTNANLFKGGRSILGAWLHLDQLPEAGELQLLQPDLDKVMRHLKLPETSARSGSGVRVMLKYDIEAL